MEQTDDTKNQFVKQIGHENFCRYSLPKNSRRINFHGKRTEKELVYFRIKDLIDQGMTSTGELAVAIAKSTRQTRRYLKKMARLRMVKLDASSGRLLKEGINYRSLSKDSFSKVPEISRWVDDCIARQIAPRTILGYLQSVRYMFGMIRANPKNIIISKGTAIEF